MYDTIPGMDTFDSTDLWRLSWRAVINWRWRQDVMER